ncbi:MAG: response regulator [Candidatus Omnitrophica bacterium]|nr:response regulator [Candidatus Omnitrophota bacterium]
MKILVVDDDYVSRTKVAALLKGYGVCDVAPDGEAALKLFEEAHKELAPYDVITMDIEMPGISGQEAVNKIRETETALKLTEAMAAKIIMVTAKTGLKEVSSSYYQGCNGYLTKPITPATVAHALGEVGIKHQP